MATDNNTTITKEALSEALPILQQLNSLLDAYEALASFFPSDAKATPLTILLVLNRDFDQTLTKLSMLKLIP